MTLPLNPWSGAEAKRRKFYAQGTACALALFFLTACSPPAVTTPETTASAPLPEEVLSQGQGIYEQLCATCHFDGHGSLTAPSLADSLIVKNSPEKMIAQILHGNQGAFVNKDGKEIQGIMPPQDSLSDEDIAAVVTYVRHTFGKVDQLTTPAEVTALRGQPR
jgi:mono/diheme cytochrome c family protein